MKAKQYSVSAGQLVYDYGSMVSAICRRMMQDEETACEAAQEIWLEVMKSLASFQGRSKLSTWIYTIAYRIAIRYAKKEKIYSTKFLRDYFRSGERDFPDDCNIDKKIWVKEMCDKCLTGISVDHKLNPRFAIYDLGTPADEGDDLVLDKEKGLIWARNANLVGLPLAWKDAINHCKALELCNLKGWRLPTKEELSSLIDPSQIVPALPKGHPFVNVKYTYWTSTTYEDFSDDAYFVHMGQGAVRAYTKHAKYEIWPVMER